MTLSTPSDLLKSDRGVDYKTLRAALTQQEWEIADRLTYFHIRQVLQAPEKSWIRDRNLKQFPPTDLQTIDRLWIQSSKGRFGFSIQRQIYLDCGGQLKGDRDSSVWEAFLDRVGWRIEIPTDDQDDRQAWVKISGALFLDWLPARRLQHEDEICYSLTAPVGYFPCPLTEPPVAGGRYGCFMEHRSLYEHPAWQREGNPW
jgi:hypothetical protein